MRKMMAVRLNMDGDKIAGYHIIFDSYQIFALQGLLAKERAERALPAIALASAASTGKAVDAFCKAVRSIPKGQLTGRKEDMEAANTKFTGMMAKKMDCSMDPNNKQLMGFDLKGVSFAECSAAEMKQQQAQNEMVGFSTGGTAFCTKKIIDEEANTAAVWMQQDLWVGGHHMRKMMAMRLNMDGDKIAGYHVIFDTYQIFALQELLSKERAERALPKLALASASAVASLWGTGVAATAFLGALALVIAFVRKKEQKSNTLLADETSA